MKLHVIEGAGNVFAVVDGDRAGLGGDCAELARVLCAPGAVHGVGTLDGLLVVTRGSGAADCRMTIFNADGSRPEACGNGLRCVAKFARENGFARADRLQVETDAGERRVDLVRDESGTIVGCKARMGAPRAILADVELDSTRGSVRATLVDMGNPHCVVFVDDERTAPVHELGRELESASRFPQRTNVGFAAVRDGRLHLRVWERGVGETRACGTGACASAVAASLRGDRWRVALPVDVELPGGTLRVNWDGTGEVVLEGPCVEIWRGEWHARAGAAR